jgi:hypothetical protein
LGFAKPASAQSSRMSKQPGAACQPKNNPGDCGRWPMDDRPLQPC